MKDRTRDRACSVSNLQIEGAANYSRETKINEREGSHISADNDLWIDLAIMQYTVHAIDLLNKRQETLI